jgi:hypothetical protein
LEKRAFFCTRTPAPDPLYIRVAPLTKWIAIREHFLAG